MRDCRRKQVGKICTLRDIQNCALTVRLFDKSIWINMCDGRIMNRKTKKIKPLQTKYDSIRTAVMSNQVVFAKRCKPNDSLCYLVEPYKLRTK